MGLGSARDVNLAEARELAAKARARVRENIDPIAARQAAKEAAALALASLTTFGEAANRFIEANSSGWRNRKHAAQWKTTLARYANPIIGNLPVGDITVQHVSKILQPIWPTKTETARRVRGRIERVLDWATVQGLRKGDNPARWRGLLEHVLPKRPTATTVRHHPALPYALVPQFMAELAKQIGEGARALEFTILTGSRTSEALGARWDEIDLMSSIWTVPPNRSKTGRAHRVPLSWGVKAILEVQRLRWGSKGFVFRSRHKDKCLSNMTLTMVLRRMRETASGAVQVWDGQRLRSVTVHGFRSTFRDWAAEQTDYPAEVAEMALAHVVGDKVEAAYRRGDLLRKRFLFMEDWASYSLGRSSNEVEVRADFAQGANEQATLV